MSHGIRKREMGNGIDFMAFSCAVGKTGCQGCNDNPFGLFG